MAAMDPFVEAACWFAEVVALVGDRWDEPGLGEWSVRDLVGHASRSLITVEQYLATPPATITVASAAQYYVDIMGAVLDHAAVAQRGRDAGAALGDDPVAAVAALIERVLPLAAAAGPDAPVSSAAGGMRLEDYLPTRTFELVVHTLDLTAALGIEVEPPAACSAEALALAGAIAAATGSARALLLAVTGRAALPAAWSVV